MSTRHARVDLDDDRDRVLRGRAGHGDRLDQVPILPGRQDAGRQVARAHHQWQAQPLVADAVDGAVFDLLANLQFDDDPLVRADIGDSASEHVRSLLFEQGGALPRRLCLLVGTRRLFPRLDLGFDDALADTHAHAADRGVVRQREQVNGLEPPIARILEVLFDPRMGNRTGHLDADVGVHQRQRSSATVGILGDEPELHVVGCLRRGRQQQHDAAEGDGDRKAGAEHQHDVGEGADDLAPTFGRSGFGAVVDRGGRHRIAVHGFSLVLGVSMAPLNARGRARSGTQEGRPAIECGKKMAFAVAGPWPWPPVI